MYTVPASDSSIVADTSKAAFPLLRVHIYVPTSAEEMLVIDSCPGTNVLNLMSEMVMAFEFNVQVEDGSGFPSMLVNAIRDMLLPAMKYSGDTLTSVALGPTVA